MELAATRRWPSRGRSSVFLLIAFLKAGEVLFRWGVGQHLSCFASIRPTGFRPTELNGNPFHQELFDLAHRLQAFRLRMDSFAMSSAVSSNLPLDSSPELTHLSELSRLIVWLNGSRSSCKILSTGIFNV